MQERNTSSKFGQITYLLMGVILVATSVDSMLESSRLGEYVFLMGKMSSGGYVAAGQIALCLVGGVVLVWTSLRKLVKA
jgi:hypothetical protein